ncbi:MAG: S8 family serine peptidase, partial [Thermoanaerobaculia bacterium]
AQGDPAARREAPFGAQTVGAKVLPLPKFLRKLLTERITKTFLTDVHELFFVAKRRAEMEQSLRERLEPGGGPFVVVGHSQGSMIAYLVLSALDPAEFDVPLFVTVGSPLGLTEVKDQIRKLTGAALTVPRCVRRWINVADLLDPVALDKGLRGDYKASPRGVKVEDDLVWNRDSPRHPHSGSGYLSTRPVRESVRQAVDTTAFQPVASFAIARDLVRELEDGPQERQKVLIELAGAGKGAEEGLDERRNRVVAALRKNLPKGERAEVLEVEELRHYVAARLTRREAELLARDAGVEAPAVKRLWRNAAKRALLERSVHTVQAHPAHVSYDALGKGVTWAVLDSGIVAHPHFGTSATQQTLERHYDCTRLGALPAAGHTLADVRDNFGHGAHVAGIIAGEYSEGGAAPKRVTGIAPRAKLWIYKVLDDSGEGEDAWIIKALDHVAATNEATGKLRIHGVNLSLGGPFDQSIYGCGHSPLCEELRRLWRQGVVVVLAAGNEGFAVLQSADGEIPANMD